MPLCRHLNLPLLRWKSKDSSCFEKAKPQIDFLRAYPVRFTRQKVLGKYIADFYCAKARLVIELDGSGHHTEEGYQYDEARTAFLEEYGLTVIRISNTGIHKNFDRVCEYIDHVVTQSLEGRRRNEKL